MGEISWGWMVRRTAAELERRGGRGVVMEREGIELQHVVHCSVTTHCAVERSTTVAVLKHHVANYLPLHLAVRPSFWPIHLLRQGIMEVCHAGLRGSSEPRHARKAGTGLRQLRLGGMQCCSPQ